MPSHDEFIKEQLEMLETARKRIKRVRQLIKENDASEIDLQDSQAALQTEVSRLREILRRKEVDYTQFVEGLE